MGEYADMILEGESCQECFTYIGEATGYPRTCRGCLRNSSRPKLVNKLPRTNCKLCNKSVKVAGLADHLRVVHNEVAGNEE